MRYVNYIIIFLLIFMNIAFALRAQEDYEYEPSELPTLVGDFNLSYNLLDEDGIPVQGAVNGVATIRILPEDDLDGKTYTLTLYLDRNYVLSRDDISLPYDFKWNFRGLSNGERELYFVLKDSEGKLGVLRIDVAVEH
jgi:hypothetical protein